MPEPSRNHCNLHRIRHRFVNHMAEDNVRVVVGFFAHDRSCLVDLVEGEVGSAGDVDEHPARAFDRSLFEQWRRSEEHTSELQSQSNLVCRLLLEKKKSRSSTPPNAT